MSIECPHYGEFCDDEECASLLAELSRLRQASIATDCECASCGKTYSSQLEADNDLTGCEECGYDVCGECTCVCLPGTTKTAPKCFTCKQAPCESDHSLDERDPLMTSNGEPCLVRLSCPYKEHYISGEPEYA